MERSSEEKTEIKKPPTYLFYLLGVILLFLAGFGIYYFGYYQYLQKQLTGLINQNIDINTNKTRVNINQANFPNPQKILIDSPKEDEVIGNPVVINGQAEVFEAMFNVRIKDANGEILGEATATAKEGQTFSPYEVSLNYATSTTEFGLIEAFDYSAKDGGVQDLISVKIKFASFGQPQTDETADLSSKALATEDWQTYQNEKYGFEVKYPLNYSESKTCQTKTGPCIVSDNISVQFDDMTGYSAAPYKGKELEINGIKLVELPLGGNRDGGLEFELGINDFPAKNKYFRILFNTDKPGLEYKIAEFRQILSTFKFTKK